MGTEILGLEQIVHFQPKGFGQILMAVLVLFSPFNNLNFQTSEKKFLFLIYLRANFFVLLTYSFKPSTAKHKCYSYFSI